MIELKKTPALKHFNDLIGHVNHYMITILIGLEGVRTKKVTKDESFNVSWNPKSLEETVKRSRRFTRNSTLSWAIDSLDAYFGFLRKKPFILDDQNLINNLEKRSIHKKFIAISDYLGLEIDFPISLIHLGIQWRNNLVHYHADNELEPQYATYLRNTKKKEIQDRFCNLDAERMLNNFNSNNSPTLKEVAAIIQSIHYFIVEIDNIFKMKIDINEYCKKIITINKSELKKIVMGDLSLKKRKLKRYFISKGFSEIQSNSKNKNTLSITLDDLFTIYKQNSI